MEGFIRKVDVSETVKGLKFATSSSTLKLTSRSSKPSILSIENGVQLKTSARTTDSEKPPVLSQIKDKFTKQDPSDRILTSQKSAVGSIFLISIRGMPKGIKLHAKNLSLLPYLKNYRYNTWGKTSRDLQRIPISFLTLELLYGQRSVLIKAGDVLKYIRFSKRKLEVIDLLRGDKFNLEFNYDGDIEITPSIGRGYPGIEVKLSKPLPHFKPKKIETSDMLILSASDTLTIGLKVKTAGKSSRFFRKSFLDKLENLNITDNYQLIHKLIASVSLMYLTDKFYNESSEESLAIHGLINFAVNHLISKNAIESYLRLLTQEVQLRLDNPNSLIGPLELLLLINLRLFLSSTRFSAQRKKRFLMTVYRNEPVIKIILKVIHKLISELKPYTITADLSYLPRGKPYLSRLAVIVMLKRALYDIRSLLDDHILRRCLNRELLYYINKPAVEELIYSLNNVEDKFILFTPIGKFFSSELSASNQPREEFNLDCCILPLFFKLNTKYLRIILNTMLTPYPVGLNTARYGFAERSAPHPPYSDRTPVLKPWLNALALISLHRGTSTHQRNDPNFKQVNGIITSLPSVLRDNMILDSLEVGDNGISGDTLPSWKCMLWLPILIGSWS